ncbi:MAG: PmoA family protein [Verrucomicrobia bacterium]|nr:PmoA family protein [Verrucomicrobiota bacterium]
MNRTSLLAFFLPRNRNGLRRTARLPLATLAILAGGTGSAFGQVKFTPGAEQVAVAVNGQPFTVFHYGRVENKPFLHPLLTPSGKNVLRGFPVSPLPGDPTDRPHQRGLWVGSEGVTGPGGQADFWENDPLYPAEGKGRIVVQKLLEATEGAEQGRLAIEAHWISPQKKVWVVERRTMTFYSQPADCRMFDVTIELTAAEPITFDDEQDGVLGLRLALPFDDHYDGKVVNEAGRTQEDVRGQRSPWLDWVGQLDPREYQSSIHGSGEAIGVAVFDHPSNHNYPARWQVRTNGVYILSPFGGKAFEKFDPTARDAAHPMKRGDTLRFRYRILIHPEKVGIAPFFKAWAAQK